MSCSRQRPDSSALAPPPGAPLQPPRVSRQPSSSTANSHSTSQSDHYFSDCPASTTLTSPLSYSSPRANKPSTALVGTLQTLPETEDEPTPDPSQVTGHRQFTNNNNNNNNRHFVDLSAFRIDTSGSSTPTLRRSPTPQHSDASLSTRLEPSADSSTPRHRSTVGRQPSYLFESSSPLGLPQEMPEEGNSSAEGSSSEARYPHAPAVSIPPERWFSPRQSELPQTPSSGSRIRRVPVPLEDPPSIALSPQEQSPTRAAARSAQTTRRLISQWEETTSGPSTPSRVRMPRGGLSTPALLGSASGLTSSPSRRPLSPAPASPTPSSHRQSSSQPPLPPPPPYLTDKPLPIPTADSPSARPRIPSARPIPASKRMPWPPPEKSRQQVSRPPPLYTMDNQQISPPPNSWSPTDASDKKRKAHDSWWQQDTSPSKRGIKPGAVKRSPFRELKGVFAGLRRKKGDTSPKRDRTSPKKLVPPEDEDDSVWFSPPVTTSNYPGGIVFKPDRMGDEEMGDAQSNGNVRQQFVGAQLTAPSPSEIPRPSFSSPSEVDGGRGKQHGRTSRVTALPLPTRLLSTPQACPHRTRRFRGHPSMRARTCRSTCAMSPRCDPCDATKSRDEGFLCRRKASTPRCWS